MVSFFVEKPYQEGDIVRVPRSHDVLENLKLLNPIKLPEKIKDRFNLEN